MAGNRTEGPGFFERLVIFVAWLASCGVVFIVGYWAGKDAIPPTAGMPPAVISVPVGGEPIPAEAPADGGTFYESLGRQAAPGSRTSTTTLAPRPVSAVRPTSTTLGSTPTTSMPTTSIPVATSTTTIALPTTTRPSPSITATTTSLPARPAATPPTTTTRPPVTGGHGWTVYVSPTRDRFEAERQRSVLRAAGYDASVVRVQRDGDMWYRVRAGSFGSEADAERARRDLRERGIGHAFVQSE